MLISDLLIQFYIQSSKPVTPVWGKNKQTQGYSGFRDGLTGDEKCLATQAETKGRALGADSIKRYATTAEAVDALKNGEVSVKWRVLMLLHLLTVSKGHPSWLKLK